LELAKCLAKTVRSFCFMILMGVWHFGKETSWKAALCPGSSGLRQRSSFSEACSQRRPSEPIRLRPRLWPSPYR
jgi:hypothetical protein